jgi:rhamnogalacturonyl hydrolase YesR/pectin methylesterase-like acyl-CoA thioesterase
VKCALKAVAFILITAPAVLGQTQHESEAMAATVLTNWKDSIAVEGRPDRWSYEQGVLLKGFEELWHRTGDRKYFDYIQHLTDRFVNDDGTIRTYKKEDYNLDNILPGRNLLLLYKVTGQEKYRKAADALRDQLRTHPRTSEGGFWHKQIYPSQMWLDGLYMAEPFYAEYAATFHEDAAFDDIAKQFVLMETHARDSKTGLLYHGWDESRKQRWANPATGLSPNFWARAMGWYAMALVDTLDYFPNNHPQRSTLLQILNRLATSIVKYQDAKSGLWYQVLDKGGAKGNYLESSASSMFVYALAKGVRQKYLPSKYLETARRGYAGIQKQFLEKSLSGQLALTGTVSVSGLGGNPYRDGSYEYYLSEKVVTNDPKGVGAFLLAANEMALADSAPKRTASNAQIELTVAADGSAKYKSIQEAVMTVPAGTADSPVIIHIKPGVYKELIYVQREKRFFRFIGEAADKTILTYDLNANLPDRDGKPIGTFRTPSTMIDADDFTAENITFANSAGPVGQALAIRVDGDRVVFRNCRFLGWQDTVLLNRGRHYFENCYLEGHVDFIFGGATAFFERCQIHCLKDGYITAASTPDNERFGFVFHDCRITGNAGVKTYLGRPWRAYANVLFIKTEMSAVVRPEGWHNWNFPEREKSARYAEFANTGAGANPKARVAWARQMTAAQAAAITLKSVLAGNDGWTP